MHYFNKMFIIFHIKHMARKLHLFYNNYLLIYNTYFEHVARKRARARKSLRTDR